MKICELCGKETTKLYKVRIEGAEMAVCKECAKFGVTPKSYSRLGVAKTSTSKTTSTKKPKRPYRDLFDNLKTLVEDYGDIIREAREKKGLTIEELAKRVGIKVSTLHKIERNELEPEEKYVKRLEKELGISLYEEGDIDYSVSSGDEGLTLGDFIKIKRK
ncbi:multiprotein bridging factor aMBF1 [Methanotorris igneus]|uniref:Transcriptional regulator, XRE family n=1 Tax=Methanotorris igneus (strain DSM 5666 / JCM 11834 / Kol 5) TaxID=880724 RepID=F6BD06_METIK|nr:multiprotein bridging factor aMBF1 [Methanotorris igneus]AEF96367.1 transcriptional regulator, XRE family [Methanotorris igneus Kol 5]